MDERGNRDCDISLLIIKNWLKGSPNLQSNGYRELFPRRLRVQSVELTLTFIQSLGLECMVVCLQSSICLHTMVPN
jgi:hypothetical protein